MVDVTRAKEKYRKNTTAERFTKGLEEYGDGDINQLQENFASDVMRGRGNYRSGVSRFINTSDDVTVTPLDLDDESQEWARLTAESDWSSKVLRAAGDYSVESNKSSNKWFKAYADAFTSDDE